MTRSGRNWREIVLGGRAQIVQGPVLSGDLMVAAAGQVAGEGLVSCWRIDDFKMLWTLPNDGFVPHLALKSVSVCNGGGRGKGARDMATGEVLWSSLDHASMTSGAWRDQVVTLAGDKRYLDVLEARTGRLVQRVVVPDNQDSTLRVLEDRVFVDVRTVRCVDLASGVLVWARDLVSEAARRPGVLQPRDGSPFLQYGVGSLPDSMIGYFGNSSIAFSAADGGLLWLTTGLRGGTGMRAFEGRMYGMMGRDFWAIDERTGEVVIRRSCPQQLSDELFIRATPAVRYRNRIAIPHETGLLAIFDADDGALVGHHRAKHALWNAVEAGGRLFVGTGSGRILVFEESIWAL